LRLASIGKFSLQTIAEALSGSDLKSARSALSFAVGSFLDVSGKVQKVVKRDGKYKLVIEPGDVPGFVVFADFLNAAENLRKLKIRKNSSVSVRGRFQSFGRRAVCLSACKIQ
jgi:hypothetical protein